MSRSTEEYRSDTKGVPGGGNVKNKVRLIESKLLHNLKKLIPEDSPLVAPAPKISRHRLTQTPSTRVVTHDSRTRAPSEASVQSTATTSVLIKTIEEKIAALKNSSAITGEKSPINPEERYALIGKVQRLLISLESHLVSEARGVFIGAIDNSSSKKLRIATCQQTLGSLSVAPTTKSPRIKTGVVRPSNVSAKDLLLLQKIHSLSSILLDSLPDNIPRQQIDDWVKCLLRLNRNSSDNDVNITRNEGQTILANGCLKADTSQHIQQTAQHSPEAMDSNKNHPYFSSVFDYIMNIIRTICEYLTQLSESMKKQCSVMRNTMFGRPRQEAAPSSPASLIEEGSLRLSLD